MKVEARKYELRLSHGWMGVPSGGQLARQPRRDDANNFGRLFQSREMTAFRERVPFGMRYALDEGLPLLDRCDLVVLTPDRHNRHR